MTQSRSQAKPRWVGHLMIWTMFAMFLSGTIWGGQYLYTDWTNRWQLNDRGVETRATVIEFYKATRGFKVRQGACDVTFEYEVDGAVYQGNEDLEENRCRGYTVGLTTLPIRYLPEHPERAWVRDNMQNLFNDFINGVVFLMGIGFCIALTIAILEKEEPS